MPTSGIIGAIGAFIASVMDRMRRSFYHWWTSANYRGSCNLHRAPKKLPVIRGFHPCFLSINDLRVKIYETYLGLLRAGLRTKHCGTESKIHQ
jgi:hypothetical protein